MIRHCALVVTGLAIANPSIAQVSDPSVITLDRIHTTLDFEIERFGPARWIENGDAYTTLEVSESFPEALDVIRYETITGEKSTLFDATQFIPEGHKEPLIIQSYEWSHSKRLLLIFTNTKRVWRRNTRGDYWILNLDNNHLMQVGKDFPESSLMFAKFSPDDARIGYVSEHNVYVEDLASSEVTALTTNGSDKLINGTFDWAYEEEFGCRDGFRWSPDGKSIAYWQVDASEIRNFLMINNTDSIYSYTIPVQYPKVGEDPSSCRIGIVSAEGGETEWIPIPGDSKQNYLPRMMWSKDSRSILIQQLNRKQNTNMLWSYVATNGKVENIYKDEDEAWLDVVDDWMWLNDGREFSWLSERTGWRQFYTISKDGKKEVLVTDADYDVVQVVQINDNSAYVYFIASPDNPTQRYLFRKSLDGSGFVEQLTPQILPGTHSYQISPGARYAIHTYSTANTPPEINMISLPDHKVIRQLVGNENLKLNLAPILRSKIEFFNVTEDEVNMDGWILRPPDFDPSKRYPVLFYVYGEPAGQTARDSWGGSRTVWYYMLAQQGYVIITMDNRGTPSPKGREWRKSIYRKIGVINSRDQAMAAKKVLKWDFIDESRVGAWGWSGGGSMTLNLLFRYPEIYQMGMSVAPVGNQLLYDNIYQERYMGVPWENEEDFIEGSPVTYAKNLGGDLLIVHGTADDNVHYQNTQVVINELIKHDKQFQMMSYPNRSHGIREKENTRRHLYKLLTNYLYEHLEPGGKEATAIPVR